MSISKPVLLDLCGGTGAWSAPWRETHTVRIIDPRTNESPATIHEFLYTLCPHVHADVVLAAPPCTEFAGSGARWWAGKEPRLLEAAIQIVDECLQIVDWVQPRVWCLENPIGRIARVVPRMGGRKWRHAYHPFEYGGYGDDPAADAYTKRTCLWGRFTMPIPKPVELPSASKDRHRIHWASPGPDRAHLRSITPPGFARAFYEANRGQP